MKKIWVLVFIVILVLVGGYVARHKVKTLMGGSSTPQTTMHVTNRPSPTASSMVPSNNIYMTKTNPAQGQYLTDFQGMTLYTFDKDTTGISNCTVSCAKIWPSYTSGATAQSTFPANITVITRADGSKQFAWKGSPLYYYASDTKAGDIMGDGVGGVWHIAKP